MSRCRGEATAVLWLPISQGCSTSSTATQNRHRNSNGTISPFRIVSVIHENENAPDFVPRIHVSVRLCDLSEPIPSSDDGSELSGFDQFFEKGNVRAQVFYGRASERTNDLCRSRYECPQPAGVWQKGPAIST